MASPMRQIQIKVENGGYTIATIPASEVPTARVIKRKHADIEAAVRNLTVGFALRISWPTADRTNRARWATNVRTAMRDRGLSVNVRSDEHYLYLIRKK